MNGYIPRGLTAPAATPGQTNQPRADGLLATLVNRLDGAADLAFRLAAHKNAQADRIFGLRPETTESVTSVAPSQGLIDDISAALNRLDDISAALNRLDDISAALNRLDDGLASVASATARFDDLG